MSKLRTLACLALLAGTGSMAQADTLQMEGISPDGNGTRPARGMSQSSVESKFGSPREKVAAVGEPPISRWEYENFIVYFEHDRVIHAVVKR